MRLLVLGGSGRTGRCVVATALKRGHQVIALLRDPSALPAQDGLTIVKGAASVEGDVEEALLEGGLCEAVIVTLNNPRTSDMPWGRPIGPPNLLLDCTTVTVNAMRKHQVKRLIFVSAWRVGESLSKQSLPFQFTVKHTYLAHVFQDHDKVDAYLKGQDDINWTMPRVSGLTNGSAKPYKVFPPSGSGAGWSISRASVAEICLDAAEHGKWIKECPAFSN